MTKKRAQPSAEQLARVAGLLQGFSPAALAELAALNRALSRAQATTARAAVLKMYKLHDSRGTGTRLSQPSYQAVRLAWQERRDTPPLQAALEAAHIVTATNGHRVRSASRGVA